MRIERKKNFKVMKKKIEKEITRWKELPCSWASRINIVKIGHLTYSNLLIQHKHHQNSKTSCHRT